MAKFYIDAHGCAKNQVDGEIIATELVRAGWQAASAPEEADLLVVNSCGFIESAKAESINAVMAARRDFPRAKILLAGCLAERYADDLAANLSEADGVFGNGDLSKVAVAAEKTLAGERPKMVFPQKGVCAAEREFFFSPPRSAFVKITEGCDNRCSFCAIPLIRGSLRSRAVDEIVAETRELVAKGFFEINLVGQDLASFGRESGFASAGASEKSPLAALLQALDEIDGDFWIRLLYIHPDNFPLDILPVVAKSKKILRYFDIPFQSGDEATLAAMNRRGSGGGYLELARKIGDALPDFALRTTFLVGFPTETEASFERTKDFLQRVAPLWSGTFEFSREDGTKAAELRGKVAKKTAKARKDILDDLQTRISQEKLRRKIGEKSRILIEEILPAQDGGESFAIGRAWFQAPEVDGATLVRFGAEDAAKVAVGSVVTVKFARLADLCLVADLVDER